MSANWLEGDEDMSPASGRDERSLHMAHAKGVGRGRMAPTVAPSGCASIQRAAQVDMIAPRDDISRVHRAGATLGATRYVPPTVDPATYRYQVVGRWRVALRRSMSDAAAKKLLLQIFMYGPLGSGYKVAGTTLVPAELSLVSTQTLASGM